MGRQWKQRLRLLFLGAPKSLQMVTAAMKLKDTSPWKKSYDKLAVAKMLQSCLSLCDPIDSSHQAPLSLGFSRQEYWSGLPFPSPMHAKSLQSCPTLCDPVDSSPPGSPVPGILQARTQEWVPFPSPFMVWKLRFDAQVRRTAVQRRCHQRAT